MQLTEKFLECAGGQTSARTTLEYQFNKKTDIERNRWYKDNDDYKTTDWQKTTSVNTEDGTLSGASRESLTVSGFNQNIENTISEDSASSFLRRLHLEAAAGDYHFRDLLSRGLNIRIRTTFGDGSFIQETHMCTTITDFNEPFKQLMNSESEITLNSRLNNEPEIINAGVGIEYPSTVTPLSVNTTVTGGDTEPIKIVVNAGEVVDPHYLLDSQVPLESQFNIAIFTEDGYQYDRPVTYDEGEQTFTAEVLEGNGKFIIVVYYAYASEGNTVFYTATSVDLVELDIRGGA